MWRGAVLFGVLASGCGYHLAGNQLALPSDVRSVSVGTLDNRSREFGLDKRLAFAIEQECLRRGALRLVSDGGASDAVLTGTIRRFDSYPVSFSQGDAALQYEATLVVDLALRRRSDDAVLWTVRGLRAVEEYSASSQVVVTSSSQFQRGALNPSDLANLTDIQLAETEKSLAIERLVQDVARDAYEQMVEGF
jgi:hypothetical protein